MDQVAAASVMRQYFNSGITRPIEFRKQQLQKLYNAVRKYEQRIYDALYADLRKGKEECYVTENGLVLSEIRMAINKIRKWAEPKKVSTNLLNFPSKAYTVAEPLGIVLIISPWNYPFQLLISPLIGAIAAGNCVVLKPSEFSVNTSALITEMIRETFEEKYVSIYEGDGEKIIPGLITNYLPNHLFYTGSTAVGKIIYKAAAEILCPVTLELGGKSPCVVERDANIKVAAKRIMLTKFTNAGQTCVAPDFVMVHNDIKKDFIKEAKNAISSFYGDNAKNSEGYGKIINEKQFDRITGLFSDGHILYGGDSDRTSLYISPTLIEINNVAGRIMKEEIFGPVLPVIGFTERNEVISLIRQMPDPLAFYVFTSKKSTEDIYIKALPFGGGCVNNTAWHVTNLNLPFGGRGASGMGKYHGKYSFETFSHIKSILKTPIWFEPSLKYPPFTGKLKWFKKLLN